MFYISDYNIHYVWVDVYERMYANLFYQENVGSDVEV